MEISCPSCGTKHRSEDFPGAFEIQCSCGYSILMPDEAALSYVPNAEEPPPSFDDAPMAMDELPQQSFPMSEDQSAPENPADQALSSLDLTDPSQLPPEMPYDPFELQEAAPQDAFTEVVLTEPQAQVSFEPPAETPVPESPQNILDRIQKASLGYLSGPKFGLRLGKVKESQAKILTETLKSFLERRPFLTEELPPALRKPEKLEWSEMDIHLPEVLAVELYLICAQEGAEAKFYTILQ